MHRFSRDSKNRDFFHQLKSSINGNTSYCRNCQLFVGKDLEKASSIWKGSCRAVHVACWVLCPELCLNPLGTEAEISQRCLPAVPCSPADPIFLAELGKPRHRDWDEMPGAQLRFPVGSPMLHHAACSAVITASFFPTTCAS